MLYDRHQAMDLRNFMSEPAAVVWEDLWLSKGEGASIKNQFEGTRDREGTILVDMLGKELRKRKINFTDPTFPPDVESLFVYPHTARTVASYANTERTDLSPFLANQKISEIKWARPAEIFPGQKIRVWNETGDDKINPEDVRQGSLGDCWFLAALCACATSEGDRLLNDLIIEDYADVGLYGVKFFVMGKWITVIVDDFFPTAYNRPLFAHPRPESSEKEIWAMIVEKAFAKLHCSYEATDAGDTTDALQYFTGGKVTKIQQKDNVEDLEIFEKMRTALAAKKDVFIGCGQVAYRLPRAQQADRAKAVGLMDRHAYAVLNAVELPKSRLHLVQVQNPWGRGEWTGAYSDKSDKWTPQLNAELEEATRDSASKNLSKYENDGAFWMEWKDFSYWFMEVRIVDPRCYDFYSEDNFARVDCGAGNWVAGKTAGGPLGSPAFEYNPRFELTGEDTKVLFSLYQPDTRHLCVYDSDSMQGVAESITMYFREKGGQYDKENWIMPDERVMTKTKEVQIQKGKVYEIVVAASAPGIEGAFAFSACGKSVSVQPCPFKSVPSDHARFMAKREGSKWKGPDGQRLEAYDLPNH